MVWGVENLINLVRGVNHLFNTFGEGNGITQFMPMRNTLSLIGNKIPSSISLIWALSHSFVYVRVKLCKVNTNILRSNLLRQYWSNMWIFWLYTQDRIKYMGDNDFTNISIKFRI